MLLMRRGFPLGFLIPLIGLEFRGLPHAGRIAEIACGVFYSGVEVARATPVGVAGHPIGDRLVHVLSELFRAHVLVFVAGFLGSAFQRGFLEFLCIDLARFLGRDIDIFATLGLVELARNFRIGNHLPLLGWTFIGDIAVDRHLARVFGRRAGLGLVGDRFRPYAFSILLAEFIAHLAICFVVYLLDFIVKFCARLGSFAALLTTDIPDALFVGLHVQGGIAHFLWVAALGRFLGLVADRAALLLSFMPGIFPLGTGGRLVAEAIQMLFWLLRLVGAHHRSRLRVFARCFSRIGRLALVSCASLVLLRAFVFRGGLVLFSGFLVG